ncbi:hypothetical protein KI387_030313, partial [Taxus chinensis]
VCKREGKRKIQNDPEQDNDQILEIYKKLNSLDNRLGNTKGRHDYTIYVLKAIYNFMEQHIKSVCVLNDIHATIWEPRPVRDLILSQLDKKDPSHVIALALFTSLQK